MTCHYCGNSAPTVSGKARKYCQPLCKSRAAWAKRKPTRDNRAQYEASARFKASSRQSPQSTTCLECDGQPVARNRCGRHYRHHMRAEGVAWAFDTDYASRARRHGVAFEPVNKAEVFDRDRWTCQLCGGKVDPAHVFPDPWSASLDHAVPMSRGGAHTPGNVQLAHLRCNVRKHDGGVQEYVDAVLELTAGGLSRPEIAAALGVTVRTVAWIRQRYAASA